MADSTSISSSQEVKEVQDKLWSGSLVIIIFVTFMANMSGNGMSNGVNALIVNAGQPAAWTGIIIAVFSIVALISRMLAGPIIDRIGSKKVLLIGLVELIVCSIICALTTDWVSLIVVRIIMGFGFSTSSTAAVVAVAEIVPRSRLGEGISLQGIAFAVSLALAPSLAIILAGYGREAMFGAAAVVFALGIVLTLFLRLNRNDDSAETAESEPDISGEAVMEAAEEAGIEAETDALTLESDLEPDTQPDKLDKYRNLPIEVHALRPAIVSAICYCAISMYMAYIPIYAEQTGLTWTTAYFCVAAAVMMLVRALFGKAFDKYPSRLLMLPALAGGIIGCIVPLVVAPTEIGLVFEGVCYGIVAGLVQPMLSADAIRRSPLDRKGAASGTFYIGCDVGVIVGSTLWGFIIDIAGLPAMFMVALGFFIVTLVANFVLLR